jgi:molybdopterin converting factor small subunit
MNQTEKGVLVMVEFFGIPRARAGCQEMTLSAATPREALAALVADCPGLEGLCLPDGRLAPGYLLSLDGTRFVTDLDQPLRTGERLLLLSADAGG